MDKSHPTSLDDIPYEVLTDTLLPLLDIVDVLHFGTTSRYFQKVSIDEHFWRKRTLKTFRLPPQPIRQKGWSELYKRLSTARVFTWGFNELGRLGHNYEGRSRGPGTVLCVRSPTEIEDLRNDVVVDLGCGGWSTFALTSSGKVYGWGKLEGDKLGGTTRGTPQLIPFTESIQRISAGHRCCLALAETGNLFIVDVDFMYTSIVRLRSPDIATELPTKECPVTHMSVGWHFAATVIKGIGLLVWKSDLSFPLRDTMLNEQHPQNHQPTRYCAAKKVIRAEESDGISSDLHAIIGLMVGEGFLIYLTEAGTVNRVNLDEEGFDSTRLTSYQLQQFAATPKLSYLSGSFYSFGLFNTAGDVLIGDFRTEQDSPPSIYPGLQRRGVIGLSWGDWHALALCEDGSILSWGKELRGNGCLGMGYSDFDDARERGLRVERGEVYTLQPMRIQGFGGDEDKFAFCVAAAGWHSAALVADFKVPEARKREW